LARILFTTFGSYGDLHPYMAIGIELQRRSHTVTIATAAAYESKVVSEGLRFHPVRPDIKIGDNAMVEYVMDRKHGTERILRFLSAHVRESYDDTLAAARQADVVVTHPITFASVLAARQLGVPWISSVLAPISFLSAIDPPVPAQMPGYIKVRALGVGPMRALWQLGKFATRRWIKSVDELQRELGLPDIGHPLFEGSHSPRLVLALFSRHLGNAQLDWPQHTLITGFPFFDKHHEQQTPPELERFLAAGPPPIVFTLGTSAVSAAGHFYRDSLQAAERMGARAVFLTGPMSQGLPEKLPTGAIAVPYAPHSEVFPRAASIVHQGGVGTTAQAMRAGRPMLIVPFAHDQFDNADLVKRKGAAMVLYHARYNATSAEQALRQLPSCKVAAVRLGEQVRAEDGTKTAADAIESSAGH
jgi:rhamnosyltransferase subunit B